MMKEFIFTSGMKDILNMFIQQKRAFGHVYHTSGYALKYFDTMLSEQFPDANTVTKETKRYDCDTVLSAMGMIPRVNEADSLRRSAPETEVYVIGDAKEAATISNAVNQAFQAALHI